MKLRDLRSHDDKARAGNAGSSLKVQTAQVLAQRDVIAWLEAERTRLAPAPDLEVRALVPPVGDRVVQQIGQPELPVLELRLHGHQLLLRGRQLLGELLAPGQQRRHVRTFAFRHADGLRVRIALGPQAVRLDLPGLAPVFQRFQALHVEGEPAPRQIARDALRIGTQQLRIDHRKHPLEKSETLIPARAPAAWTARAPAPRQS